MVRVASVKMIELARCQLIVALYPVSSGELKNAVDQRLVPLMVNAPKVKWMEAATLQNLNLPGPKRAIVFTCPKNDAKQSMTEQNLTPCKEGKGAFNAGLTDYSERRLEELVICPKFWEEREDNMVIREKLQSALLPNGRDFRLELRGACTSSSHGLPALLISPSQLL